jgi:hypothetical protein
VFLHRRNAALTCIVQHSSGQLLNLKQVDLILPDVLGAEFVWRAVEVFRFAVCTFWGWGFGVYASS